MLNPVLDAAVLATILAAVFLLALRVGPRWTLVVAVAPFAIVYLIAPDVRVYSIHGFIHTPIVYQILENGVPAENPFFAGYPVHYPYGYHAVVAWLASTLNITPAWVFAGGNLLAIIATCALIAGIGRLYTGDKTTGVFAAFLALFGSAGREVSNLMRTLDVPGYWANLALPISKKFINLNLMPVGVLCFALGIFELLRILTKERVSRGAHLVFAIAVALCGLLYPWTWLGLVAAAGAMIGTTWLFNRPLRKNALIAAGAVGIATLALLPYLLSLTQGKAPGTGLGPAPNVRAMGSHAAHLLLMLWPLWLLVALRARTLSGELRSGLPMARLLVAGTLALAASFVFVHQVSGAEYKLRSLTAVLLAALAAPTLTLLYRARPWIALVVVAFLLWPASYDLVRKLSIQRPVSDPYVEEGYALVHGDAQEGAMYRWITDNTASDAVFVDTEPTITTFARRSVFFAGDVPDVRKYWNGWNHDPDLWLYWVHGVSKEDLAARRRVVGGIYGTVPEVGDEEITAALRKAGGERDVFVLARNSEQEAALGERSFLTRVSGQDGWAIYRLTGVE